MGVDRTDYIIYGFNIPPAVAKENGVDIWDDKYLPFMEGRPGIFEAIVYDGMSGEYLVFGKVIHKSEDYEGIPLKTVSYKDFFDDSEKDAITQKFIELFGQNIYDNEIEDEEPQVIIFSHFH